MASKWRWLAGSVTLLSMACILYFISSRSRSRGHEDIRAPSVSRLASPPGALEDSLHELSDTGTISGRSSPPSRSDGLYSIQIHVVDSANSPVASAQVASILDGKTTILGFTSLSGVITITTTGDSLLCAFKDHVGRGSLQLPSEPGAKYEVVLLESPHIVGRVIESDGSRPEAQVLVLAWATDLHQDGITHAIHAMAGEPTEHLASTELDGTFLIPDLSDGVEYSIAAGGSGYVAVDHQQTARVGDPPITITVERVYGAIVSFLDPVGASINLNRFSPGGVRYQAGSRERGLKPYPVKSASAILAGIHDLPDDKVDHCKQFMMTTEQHLGDTITNYVTLRVPGYDTAEKEFPASWLAKGLGEVVVTLEPSATKWGTIAVDFVRRDNNEDKLVAPLAGQLYLSGTEKLSFAIRDGVDQSAILDGIPYGTYSWRFAAEYSEFMFPPKGHDLQRIDVGSMSARIKVEVPSCGELDVAVRTSDGLLYDGPAVVTIGVGVPRVSRKGERLGTREVEEGTTIIKHAASVRFESSPYRLTGLPAGHYFLRLEHPFRAQLVDNDSVVSIQEKEATSVEFSQGK